MNREVKEGGREGIIMMLSQEPTVDENYQDGWTSHSKASSLATQLQTLVLDTYCRHWDRMTVD